MWCALSQTGVGKGNSKVREKKPQERELGGRGGGCLILDPAPNGAIPKGSALPFPDRNAELDFSTFLNIMYRQMKQEEPEKEILRALAMIDQQKRGVISVPELRAKLTRLGEKLSEEEGILQFPQGSNPSFHPSFPPFLPKPVHFVRDLAPRGTINPQTHLGSFVALFPEEPQKMDISAPENFTWN